MNITKFSCVKIKGISCAVPCKIEDNFQNKDFSELDLKRFIKGTGVKQRRISPPKQTASDLCFLAAKNLLAKKNISPDCVDALIYITQFADYHIPSTAYILAYRLGLSQNCLAFDVNLGCSAFVYGVHIASSLIQGGNCKRVLVAIGDDIMKWGVENPKDEMLFGKCGSAVLFEKTKDKEQEKTKGIESALFQDGSRYGLIIAKNGAARHPENTDIRFCMTGDELMYFTLGDVSNTINEFLKTIGKTTDDFDVILLHQANLVIIKGVAHKIDAKQEKVPISIDRFGNTDGSTIPLTLVDFVMQQKKLSKQLPKKLNVLSSGFGVGLSWGVNTFEIDAEDVFSLIESDDYYKEAI